MKKFSQTEKLAPLIKVMMHEDAGNIKDSSRYLTVRVYVL